jgi:hypothetical protein
MPQIFPPSVNHLARASIGAVVITLGVLGWLGYEAQGSPYVTRQGIVRDQPVPFSHQHHVQGLGIDCRYCHTSVEDSSFAGIPPTETCMTCHSKVWTNANLLQPIRTSWATNYPISGPGGDLKSSEGWVRIHNLPDFVYFNHSIHVNKGVGCSTCHGHVETMPLMLQAANLQMEWCLKCHREPTQFLRPRDKIFDMNWEPGPNQAQEGAKLAEEYHVAPVQHLQTCYVCHR